MTRGLVFMVLLGLALPVTAAEPTGVLFPEPFVLEHHLVHEDADGSRFVGESVVDTYFGSWLVSVRPDGSRLIVDFGRRELTEIRDVRGTFWTVSFDRLAELQRRLRAAQGLVESKPAFRQWAAAGMAEKAAPRLPVTELSDQAFTTGSSTTVERRRRRFRVAAAGDIPVEVWVDSTVRLGSAAAQAVEGFEALLLDASQPVGPATVPGRYVAAARVHAAGAVPVRTRRPVLVDGAGAALGWIEDEATRLERLERFPLELARVPAGLRRVPHPIEAAVRWLEDERSPARQ
jgi:hypothetical protein